MTRYRLAVIATGALLAWASTATAQLTIPAGGDGKITVLGAGQAVTMDMTQSALGLSYSSETWARSEQHCRQIPDPAARQKCAEDYVRNQLTGGRRSYFEFAASLAAEKGKRKLFSGGNLTPGLEVTATRGIELQAGVGHHQFYFAPTLEVTAVDVAEATATGAWKMETRAHTSVGSWLGYNVAFSQSNELGVAVKGTRELSTPGKLKPVQVCVQQSTGTDEEGKPATAAACSDRIVGELSDSWAGQLRADYVRHFARRVSAASFGFVIGGASNLQEGLKPSYSLSLGPTLHRVGSPGQVLAAALLSVTDLTDANDRDLDFWKDQFALTLYLGIPLTAF